MTRDRSEIPQKTVSMRLPPTASDKRVRERRTATNARILTGSILIIAVLYVARQVFIPVALAILFAFLLRPVVQALEHTILRRTGSIVIAIAIAVAVLSTGGWLLVQQVQGLAREVASYGGNIEKKLSFLKGSPTGTIALFEKTLQRVTDSTEKLERPDLKVRVIPEKRGLPERYQKFAPTLELVASSFLVIVLVFFLLKDREQLRDKALRLAGRANITVTTQAIGETSHRISRYLLTLSVINIIFGSIIWVGLFFLGVPHASLWGVLAGLLRFVPYVGAFLSAGLPTLLSLAVFPDWYVPLAVMGLFLLADQILAGFIEPLVIGHRVGVSPIALLLAAIFWGWLWGPVGLILATPITVCLTVAGEFIPALRIFSILFGTEAPLEGYLSFYNRLLLRDRAGAIAIADRYAESSSMEQTFNEILIPTLSFAAEELSARRVTKVHDHFIKDVTREAINVLGDRNASISDPERHLVAVSVAGERLSLGTLMLTQVLRSEGFTVHFFTELPIGELVNYIRELVPEAVFVSCSNAAHREAGLEMVSTLAQDFPDLTIVAGGSGFAADTEETLRAGAAFVPTMLTEGKEEFLRQIRRSRRKGTRTMPGQIRVPGM